MVWTGAAQAQSLGNSYLDVRSDTGADNVFGGDWYIAVDDLDSVFHLDRNTDGTVAFDELKPYFDEIAKYAYARLHFSNGHQACEIRSGMEAETNRQDAREYLALFFKVICPTRQPSALIVDYELFFDIDPNHNGVFVFRNHDRTDTAFFSSSSRHIRIGLSKPETDN